MNFNLSCETDPRDRTQSAHFMDGELTAQTETHPNTAPAQKGTSKPQTDTRIRRGNTVRTGQESKLTHCGRARQSNSSSSGRRAQHEQQSKPKERGRSTERATEREGARKKGPLPEFGNLETLSTADLLLLEGVRSFGTLL